MIAVLLLSVLTAAPIKAASEKLDGAKLALTLMGLSEPGTIEQAAPKIEALKMSTSNRRHALLDRFTDLSKEPIPAMSKGLPTYVAWGSRLIRFLDEVAALAPDDFEVQAQLAVQAMRQATFMRADGLDTSELRKLALERADRLATTFATLSMAHLTRATLYNELGDQPNEVIRSAGRCLELTPSESACRKLVARLLPAEAAREVPLPLNGAPSIDMNVVLTARGEVFLDGAATDLQHLRKVARQTGKSKSNARAIVTADVRLPKDRVNAIIEVLRTEGIAFALNIVSAEKN